MSAAADDQVGFCVHTRQRACIADRRCLMHIAQICRHVERHGKRETVYVYFVLIESLCVLSLKRS